MRGGSGSSRPAVGRPRPGRSRLPLLPALSATLVALSMMSACASAPTVLRPQVMLEYPHDPHAFTQGLLFEGGVLYESTGLYGESSLREVDLETGEPLRTHELEADLFGEGLALVEDRLIQLTWRAGMAIVYDRRSFEELERFSYEGEGWGLCYDGSLLWMSDGSSTLTIRDPDDFTVVDTVEVTLRDEPVTNLNELECVGEHVYANVWYSNAIVRIVKGSGRIDMLVDASTLLPARIRESLSPDAVLNGIAYDSQRDLFYLTGKLWPSLFAVRFD